MECYHELAVLLAEHDMLVFGHDLAGHGMSEGPRGIIQSLQEVTQHTIRHTLEVNANTRVAFSCKIILKEK